MNAQTDFRAAVLDMQGNLLSFALKLTYDREEARDLVQETTLKALNNEDKFIDDTNFKGWILTIMRNIFINNYRRAGRENTMVDTTDDAYHINLAQETNSSTPESSYALTEIASILADFPADYREPFSMHLGGYKYDEIAEQLDMPLGTVKSRIFLTRKRLREILVDYRD